MAAGIAAIGLRLWWGSTQPTGQPGSAWTVNLTYRIQANKRGAQVTLAPPWDKPDARLYSQQLTLDGLQLRRTKSRRHAQRLITLIATRRGETALTAEFSIHRVVRKPQREPEKSALEPDERQHYLAGEPGIEVNAPAVQDALKQAAAPTTAPADRAQRLFEFVRGHIAYSAHNGAATAAAALTGKRAGDLGQARALVALCRAARLPARVVTGFQVADQDDPRPLHWAQIYQNKRWTDYDPAQGFEGRLPADFVAFSRDGPLLGTSDASVTSADYQVEQVDVPASLAGGQSNPINILDLSRLPLSARATLATLLLLPLGALLNTFVRSVVGVQTFGTFTPAMLALAAVYVDWLTAAVIFAVVAIIALFGRSTLPGLQLVRAPRLTIVFALVALAMALAISIMAYFDLLAGAQVVLLPIVILTSLVDRVYTVVDEQGVRTALMRLVWTAATAVGCFFILTANELGEWLVSNPEAHLITIALVIALSAYRGPRLARAKGLRWLGEPARTRAQKEEGDD